MGDYNKSIIYTIRTGDKLYVGSTTNYAMRKYKHKSQILHNKSVKLYNVIRENNGEWDMKPYSQFPCENRMELHIEEERLRRELNADLNMGKCNRTEKDKKEYFDNYNKNRTIQQKENDKLNHSIKIICECGCEIRKDSLSKHRKSQKHLRLINSKS
tara:strand:+ start:120 stop:590 length:471 start_codon:yes stop_codon:yes gene_type:complete